ncbi:MAG: glycosyltransferase family 2 protein [Fibrobacter sp.]|nr:glycosyltransferase family 2 protein [Fibrobacter sp.]
MKTAIILVTYNGWKITNACLQCLKCLPQENFVITVIDNASSDETPCVLPKEFPDVKFFPLNQNVGFGRANNEAVRKLVQNGENFDSICFLNNDTLFSMSDIISLQNALNFLNEKKVPAVLTARLQNQDGSEQENYYRKITNFEFLTNAFRNQKTAGKYLHGTLQKTEFPEFLEAFWFNAACWMMSRSVFERLGGFDEHFFMYYEDMDFALRAQNSGVRFFLVSKIRITHLGGGSTASSQSQALQHDRSQEYIFEKHYGKKGLVLSKIFRILRSSIRILFASFKIPFSSKARMTCRNHGSLLWHAMTGFKNQSD